MFCFVRDIGIYYRYIFCVVLIIILIFVFDILFQFFCFSVIKIIFMRNLFWECVFMFVGWLQIWCLNNVLKMRFSLLFVFVVMEVFRIFILLFILGVNILKMLELSIRLEQYFKFNCKICFQLIYLCISNFIGMRDWSDF